MPSLRKAFRGVIVTPKTLQETTLIADGAVLLGADGIISHVLDMSAPGAEALLQEVDEVVDKRGCFIMPGFVDGHAHAPQYAWTGTGMDLPLLEWLETYTFPGESRFKDLSHARKVYERSVRRHLRAGTTTCSYFGTLHLEATKLLVDIVREAGQRAYVGKVSMDRNSPEYYVEDTEEGLKAAEEFVQWCQEGVQSDASVAATKAERDQSTSSYGSDHTSCESSEGDSDVFIDNSLVTPVVTPRFVPSCTPEMLRGLGSLATRYRLPVQSHLGETLPEIAWVRDLHPESATYTHVYDDHGLLPSREDPESRPPIAYMAHCCHCCQDERALLSDSSTGVVHCPSSNIMLGSGILSVRRMLADGVKVGLGTDVAGGYSPSILDALRQAIIASKTVMAAEEGNLDNIMDARVREGVEHNPNGVEALSVSEAYYLATMGGAECLGLQDTVGSFEPGKTFDALVVDLEVEDSPVCVFPHDTHWDSFNKFIFNGDDRNIVEVHVGGRRVVSKN
eukprot:scaffold109_cov252-Pinguiococcus_pyrenoidosus.AAC.85